jgi:hypothetical protein
LPADFFLIVDASLMRRRHGRAIAALAFGPRSNHAPFRPKNVRKAHGQRRPLRWLSKDAAKPPIETRPQRMDTVELQGKRYI